MNKILMVGHLLHYHPAIEKIKEIVESNLPSNCSLRIKSVLHSWSKEIDCAFAV